MDPLSPFAYHRRHKRQAALLAALISLTTLGVYVMVAVLDSIPTRARVNYLTRVARVYPANDTALEPGVLAEIEMHPDVERVVLDSGLAISPPALIGYDKLRLMGVSSEDAQYLMAHLRVRLAEGRMCEPRANEFVLSGEIARALRLRLGDQIVRSMDEIRYAAVSSPLVLVGILEGDPTATSGPSIRVGFVSREYLEGHEAFGPRVQNALVAAREGRQAAVNEYLETTIASARTATETFREVSRYVTMGRAMLGVVSGIVNCLVAAVAALVVGAINRIALLDRVEELGLLYAMGYQKRRVIGRLTLETAVVAALGAVTGLMLAVGVLYGLKASVYYALGQELDVWNPLPVWFIVPIPLVVVAFSYASARRLFGRLDAVAIIEHGRQSMETTGRKGGARRSSARPLSSWVFYARHRRRGSLLALSMSLMILGVAFPAGLFSSVMSALSPGFASLRYVSEVTPVGGDAIGAGVTAQIRAHPAVARVFPAQILGLQVTAPLGSGTQMAIYGVAEGDLDALLQVFGSRVVEGRLPRPRTNEIAIPRGVALNRGLVVGNAIGRPVQERSGAEGGISEDDIPGEMVIVGLLSPDDMWVGFASREYLESHELTAARPLVLLVVPAAGLKAELDVWLATAIASPQVRVNTYEASWGRFRSAMQGVAAALAAVECLIAVVAAAALAVLNYIFLAQRQGDFAILQALGRSRRWLILRTVTETTIVVGLAWAAAAAVSALGMLGFQALIYTPRGLSLDVFGPIPWLFTVPIPLAVICVAAGTAAQTLGRLDPVAVIEKR